ncbi:MAG: hypothetical protein GWO02_05170 [Gammaproteobacteria bacterium]|nr:hypothetical protein [Gammaproteobacteria bacterium]
MPGNRRGFPQKISRRVQLLNLVESSQHQIEIPRVHDLNTLEVILDGEIVVGTAAALAVPAESPAQLLQRVDLVANGKDVLEQIPYTIAVHGNFPRRFDAEVTQPGTTVATHPFRAVAFLDRVVPDSLRPKDTAFKAFNTNLLQMLITTGQASDILDPDATTTLTLQNTTIEVVAHSLLEDPEGDRDEAKVVRKRTLQTETFTGSNNNLRVKLPTGNKIRFVQVHALDDAGGNFFDPTDALINSMSVAIDGVDVRHNLTYGATRSANRSRWGIAPPAGFALADSVAENELAKMTNYWDLRRASLAELVIDHAAPTGNGRIEVVIDEYIGVPD